MPTDREITATVLEQVEDLRERVRRGEVAGLAFVTVPFDPHQENIGFGLSGTVFASVPAVLDSLEEVARLVRMRVLQ